MIHSFEPTNLALLFRRKPSVAAVMQVPAKLWSLTATKALSLIKRDRLTVEDYAKALVSRIESRDSVVKAWKYFGKPNLLLHAKQARLIFCKIRTLS